MRRRRFQKGSLQLRRHADRRVWVVLYYDEKSERRYHTLGWASEMNKGTADEKRQEFMREINGGARTTGAIRPPTVAEFLNQVYLPFYLGKWKESTAGTSENRLRHHIEKELGAHRLKTSRWRRSSSSWSGRRQPGYRSASWITCVGTCLRFSRWRCPKK